MYLCDVLHQMLRMMTEKFKLYDKLLKISSKGSLHKICYLCAKNCQKISLDSLDIEKMSKIKSLTSTHRETIMIQLDVIASKMKRIL